MWYYAAAIFGFVVIAEDLGFGGIPGKVAEIDNILLIGLLITFIVTVFKGFVRR